MRTGGRQRRELAYPLLIGCLLLLILPGLLEASATKEATLPLYQQKYHVAVSVGFSTDITFNARFRRNVISAIEQDINRVIGQLWEIQIKEETQRFPHNREQLMRIDWDKFQQDLALFRHDDFLNTTLLLTQLVKAGQSAEILQQSLKEQSNQQSQKKSRKVTRKFSVAEKVWLQLPKDLQTRIKQSFGTAEAGLKQPTTKSQPLSTKQNLRLNEQDFLHTLLHEFNRIIKGSQLVAESANPAAGVRVAAARELLINGFPDAFRKMKFNKAFKVIVEKRGAEYIISGREWDESTRSFSDIQQDIVERRSTLSLKITGLLNRLFRPHFQIDSVEADKVLLQVQGGAYPTPDSQTAQLQAGDLLQPYLRYFDRRRIIQKIQFLDWSYLKVTQVERERITCQLISGIRTPLGTSRRRRVETSAIAIKPAYPSSTLQLLPRKGVQVPLAGYQVTVATSKEAEDKTASPPLHLLSDRNGKVTISTNPQHPLLWLFIRSGKALLARIPFVPGQVRELSVPLPNDSLRLRVEGDVAILRGNLIDLVARRATMMARISAASKKSDWKKVDELLKLLEDLPDAQYFSDRLLEIEVPAVNSATRSKDRLAASRIKKLCSDTKALVTDFLDDNKVQEIKESMQELRKEK